MKSEFASVVSKSRMSTLAGNWDVKDLGLELVDLGSPQKIIGEEISSFRFQFYRSSMQAQTALESSSKDVPSTPVRGGSTSDEGLVNIKVANLLDVGKTPKDIFHELVQKYNVPPETQFQLYHKIRVFLSLHSAPSRRQLLSIKLLAISVLCK
jgi:hypothetical protein